MGPTVFEALFPAALFGGNRGPTVCGDSGKRGGGIRSKWAQNRLFRYLIHGPKVIFIFCTDLEAKIALVLVKPHVRENSGSQNILGEFGPKWTHNGPFLGSQKWPQGFCSYPSQIWRPGDHSFWWEPHVRGDSGFRDFGRIYLKTGLKSNFSDFLKCGFSVFWKSIINYSITWTVIE